MNDLKTTVSSVMGVIAFVTARFGLELPADVTDGIIVLTIMAVGYFARDSYVQKHIEVNPSIFKEKDKSADIRKNISDKTKIKRV